MICYLLEYTCFLRYFETLETNGRNWIATGQKHTFGLQVTNTWSLIKQYMRNLKKTSMYMHPVWHWDRETIWYKWHIDSIQAAWWAFSSSSYMSGQCGKQWYLIISISNSNSTIVATGGFFVQPLHMPEILSRGCIRTSSKWLHTWAGGIAAGGCQRHQSLLSSLPMPNRCHLRLWQQWPLPRTLPPTLELTVLHSKLNN